MHLEPRLIAYWAATIVSVVGVGGTGLLDLSGAPAMAQHVTALGYPAYLQHFLGVAKLLGAVVILLPRLPRLKEWAYAGMTFDLMGATYSHFVLRDAAAELALPASLLVLLALSYLLRPASRRLPAALDPSRDAKNPGGPGLG
jgi:uncharacterized membrane protein YphA (DoxX/SURF4 family)